MALSLRPTTPATLQEYLYKILVIGDFGVGKTAVIRRYSEGYFTPNYKLTIGVDFAVKSLDWDLNTKIALQLWDIAGHERFGQMTRVYYKYAIGAVIVYDLSRPVTFESVFKWLNDVNQKVMLSNEEPIPIILLANKCDLDGVDINKDVLNKFCKDHNLVGWFSTSAKDDINITEAMSTLVSHILDLDLESKKPTNDQVPISNKNHNSQGAPNSITTKTDAPPKRQNVKDQTSERSCCS